ncbi:MAG: hypothetical protein KF887_07115 [Paracoccaceae bacterium]|nr:MAG: hypothetical protein KF887_07115 [Paracoccaceae bacterium]
MPAPAPLTEAVIARLEAMMPAMTGRVRRAADLSALMRNNAAPQSGMSAFVLPGGIEGGQQDRASGAHLQIVTRVVTIVLMFRAGDPAANAVVDQADVLIADVAQALAGWVPPGTIGDPMAFRRVSAPSGAGGTFVYEMQFAARDQLRT